MGRYRKLWPIVLLLGVMGGLFGDVLFVSHPPILSNPESDLQLQFAYWREFGFEQLRSGNIALWNPHIFAGVPFLGTFQSALLYPLNGLFLFVALPLALNISFVLHLFLAALSMYAWSRYRELSRLASLFAALTFSFGSAVFLRIDAGHLPHLSALSWAPLVMLATEALVDRPTVRRCLCGILVVAMQILAGHPQFVFCTAVCAGLYVLLRLASDLRRASGAGLPRWRRAYVVLAGLVVVYAGGAAIAAGQLFPGVDACRGCARVGPVRSETSYEVGYGFCAQMSFPPENFVTLVAPWFFGDTRAQPYWGRGYLHEITLFIGVGGLILALVGCAAGDRRKRAATATMVFLTAVLALGGYTPLLRVLYDYVPGFNLFRCNARFAILGSMFLAMLAGMGLDCLIRRSTLQGTANGSMTAKHLPLLGRGIWLAPAIAICLCVALALLAVSVRQQSGAEPADTWWHGLVIERAETSQGIQPEQAGVHAARQLLIAAALLGVYSILLVAVHYRRQLGYVIFAVATLEVLLFARSARRSFDPAELLPPPNLAAFLAAHAGDYRIYWPNGYDNVSMTTGWQSISGYDTLQPRRVPQFTTFAMFGSAPRSEFVADRYHRFCKFLRLLRCRYVIRKESDPGLPQSPGFQGDGLKVYQIDYPLPRLILMEQWEVLTDRAAIFQRLASPDFDPRRQVILERAPDPAPPGLPATGPPGEAQLLESNTDDLLIRARLTRPAILVITDGYAEGWRARDKRGQRAYQVIPANYALRAIPLEQGEHLIRVEYSPLSWRIGVWISGISVVIYVLMVVMVVRRRTA